MRYLQNENIPKLGIWDTTEAANCKLQPWTYFMNKYHALVFVILVYTSYLTPNQKVGSEIVMKYTNVYEEEKTRRRKNLAYNV